MEPLAEFVALPAAQAMGWALVHFVWQGALLAPVLAGLLALPAFRAPHARYVLCLVFLAAMVAVPPITCWTVYDPARGVAPVDAAAAPGGLGQLVAGPFQGDAQTHGGLGGSSAPAEETGRRAYTPPLPRRAVLRWNAVRERLAPYVPWCALAWFAGVVVLAVRNVAAWAWVQRLRSKGTGPVPESVARLLESLCARMGIRRAVACVQSSRLSVPATIGWLKPVILLPASALTGLEAAQLEAILAHELAHIRRHDYLVNLFQTCAETVLFYHPAVWWLSRRIRLERELCCDDRAVQMCESDAAYAEALARVEALRRAPALAMAASGGSLLIRIRRLAQPAPVRQSRLANALLGLGIVLCAGASLFGPHLPALFAQETGQAPGARTIGFPEWSMGQIMIRPWGSPLDQGWETFQPAMGAVAIPAGMEVQLVVDNNAVTDLSPLAYLGAQDLQSVNFRRTEIQDGQLAYIEGLELRDLNFELTEITDGALQYFDDMTSLESLSVGRTNVTNNGVPYLSGLTGLRQLDLNLTGVDDEGLAYLANLTNLEYLDLWNAAITDESLAWIGTLTNLQALGLEGAPITDAGLAHLRNLTNLEDLNLQSTPVTDAGVEYLSALSLLANLNLRNTRVTEVIVDFLAAQFDLQRFNLPKQISPEAFARMEGSPRYRSGSIRMQILVQDGNSKKPVYGAKLEVKFRQNGNTVYTPDVFWTGESGAIEFYVSYDHTADVSVYAEGYVPAAETWEPGQNRELTVTLRRASTIGGLVVNESGVSVEGVSVKLAILGERDYLQDALMPHAEITGERGAWSCPHAPADLAEFWLELEHPEYVATKYTAEMLSPGRLKSGSERLVIRKGIDVSGTVQNEVGEPIAGASLVELKTIRQGLQTVNNNATRTDEAGSFQFTNQKSGPIRLKINAGGYLPLVEDVEFSAGAEPLRFTLTMGRLLKGRVVDGAGKPIQGVRIELPVALGNGEVDHLSWSWKTVTDHEGRFSWDEAPEEAIPLSFNKPGYVPLQKDLTASDDEIVVVMEEEFRPVRISGAVLDAESGDPISDFKVVAKYDSGRAHFSYTKGSSDGSYAMESRDFGPEFTLTVEADGYYLESSPAFRMADGDATYDFRLKPAPKKTGIVRNPDGTPAAGALYAMTTPMKEMRFGDTIFVKNGSLDPGDRDRVKQTDSEGRFAASVRESPCILLITHEDGFARVNPEEMEDDSEITLQRWARLEGVVTIGTDPAPGARIFFQLESAQIPTYSIDTYETRSDEAGKFACARVFPGHAWLRRMPENDGSGTLDFVIARYVEVPEGETVLVQLGGTGRPLKGKVSIPEDLKKRLALDEGSSGQISERYPISWPEDADTWSEEERIKWTNVWFKSEEGKNAIRHQNAYGFYLDEDGNFLIDDVEAGPYELRIRLLEQVEGKRVWEFPLAGTVEHDFDVPEMEGGAV